MQIDRQSLEQLLSDFHCNIVRVPLKDIEYVVANACYKWQ